MIWEQHKHQDRFSALAKHWSSMKLQEQGSRIAVQHCEVDHWRKQLREMRRQHQTLREMGLWIAGPRNLLSVVGRARYEPFHSAVLAWLLDPAAPHGLGSTFLSRFLARCLSEEPHLYPSHAWLATRTATEVMGPTSRADIVVTLPTVVLIIELKVDSGESELQCARLYADFLDYETGTETRFAFLTPSGRPARTEGQDAAGLFRPMSFRDIRDDLGIALRQSAAVRNSVASTVSGFAAVIDYLSVLEDEM